MIKSLKQAGTRDKPFEVLAIALRRGLCEPAAMTDRAKSRINFYSGAALDRAEHLRRDGDWHSRQWDAERVRCLTLWRSHHLVAGESDPLWFGARETRDWIEAGHQHVFLGLSAETALVAIDLSPLENPEDHPHIQGRGAFRDLREFGPLVARDQGAILAYARGLLHWHQRHRFCAVCGHPSDSIDAGHVRRCRNPDCGAMHFPRTDPAVIMLIHDGAGNCVLGRQKNWPPGMNSTLAGFVEPGESLEEAVAREVWEEVGLTLEPTDVHYHSSQPWPFPSSLMLGFHAYCPNHELVVNQSELADARWYSREELRTSPEDETFRLPRRDSIARHLVNDWLAEA